MFRADNMSAQSASSCADSLEGGSPYTTIYSSSILERIVHFPLLFRHQIHGICRLNQPGSCKVTDLNLDLVFCQGSCISQHFAKVFPDIENKLQLCFCTQEESLHFNYYLKSHLRIMNQSRQKKKIVLLKKRKKLLGLLKLSFPSKCFE